MFSFFIFILHRSSSTVAHDDMSSTGIIKVSSTSSVLLFRTSSVGFDVVLRRSEGFEVWLAGRKA